MISSLQNILKSSNDYLELKMSNLSDTQRNVATIALAIFAMGVASFVYNLASKLYDYVFKRLEPRYPVINGMEKGRLTIGTKVFDLDGKFNLDQAGYLNGKGKIKNFDNSCELEGVFKNGKLLKGQFSFQMTKNDPLMKAQFFRTVWMCYKVDENGKQTEAAETAGKYINFAKKFIKESQPCYSAVTQGPTSFMGKIFRGSIFYNFSTNDSSNIGLPQAEDITIDPFGNINGKTSVFNILGDEFKGVFKDGKMIDGVIEIKKLNDHEYKVEIKENKLVKVTEDDTFDVDITKFQDEKNSKLVSEILKRWSYTTSVAEPV